MKPALKLLEELSKDLIGISLTDQKKVDDILYAFYNEKKCLNLVYPISYGLAHVQSKVYDIPVYKSIQKMLEVNVDYEKLIIPELFVSLL